MRIPFQPCKAHKRGKAPRYDHPALRGEEYCRMHMPHKAYVAKYIQPWRDIAMHARLLQKAIIAQDKPAEQEHMQRIHDLCAHIDTQGPAYY